MKTEDIVETLKEKFPGKILKLQEKSKRRIYCDCKPEDIPALVQCMFQELECRFVTTTGIDTPAGIEMLYHFSDDRAGKIISLRALITDKKRPEIASITPLITGAEWIEREIWELLGVRFKGHPNLKHLLLIDEWPEGEFPLRHKQ